MRKFKKIKLLKTFDSKTHFVQYVSTLIVNHNLINYAISEAATEGDRVV